MKIKKALSILLIATLGGIIAIGATKLFSEKEVEIIRTSQVPYPQFTSNSDINATALDFTIAAQKAVNGVVHIKTSVAVGQGNTLYDYLFGEEGKSFQQGVGSGVIISEDGYIVTNNHVIDKSNEIEVVLNDKRSYKAKVVGKDISTDLALLKIEADSLSPISYGDAENLKIGEWVLAIGNPFNLTSTVTAGIISAKGRNINIMEGQYSIESFIQTDAAVNPGNSGGALVNIKGELIGVNTAIASRTGSFSGYSFAIPSNIVEKVMADLKEYGIVQRALLGVSILDMTAEIAKSLNLEKIEGVLVEGIMQNSSAEKAGIVKNDVILKIDDKKVNKVSELQEQISMHRPGDKINVTIIRDKQIKKLALVLQNKIGNTEIINSNVYSQLGASFTPLLEKEKEKLGLTSGVRVSELEPGKLLKAGVRNGYIITHINRKPVSTMDDINELLKNANGGVYLRGIYPNGLVEYYAFGME